MGIFAYHIGKIDIPEEHREEWARQVLELLRAGGMMTIETLQLYKKKIYLLSPPEFDEEGRATGYYNYFEKDCWEDWWLSTKRGSFKRGRFFTQEPSPLYPPRSARIFHSRGNAIPAPYRSRQSRRFLESASLHPPPAALRRFPLDLPLRAFSKAKLHALCNRPPIDFCIYSIWSASCSAWPLLRCLSKSKRWSIFGNEQHPNF